MDAATTLGIKRVEDINASDEERTGYTAATMRKGKRVNSARAFLHPAMKRPNLTVLTGAIAQRIVFESDRAVGVEVSSAKGKQELRASREVIVSCGSLATPKLLQLSGIGPKEVLTAAGVDVRVDSPESAKDCASTGAYRCRCGSKRTKATTGFCPPPLARRARGCAI